MKIIASALLATATLLAAHGPASAGGETHNYEDGVRLGRSDTDAQRQFKMDQLIIHRQAVGSYRIDEKYRQALNEAYQRGDEDMIRRIYDHLGIKLAD